MEDTWVDVQTNSEEETITVHFSPFPDPSPILSPVYLLLVEMLVLQVRCTGKHGHALTRCLSELLSHYQLGKQ